jgi:hypothetical protein
MKPMRTEELMRKYQHGKHDMPNSGWEKMVFLAAELIKTAKDMRNTSRRNLHRKKIGSDFIQDDLWEN